MNYRYTPEEIGELNAENDRLRAALDRLRKTASLLFQNSVGCATNHYGNDHELHGLPGWLAAAEKDIQAALAALSK